MHSGKCGIIRSGTEIHSSRHPKLGVRYNGHVPNRRCTSRAEWRLQPGKPAEPLSAHYRLDCDYGTAVVTCWDDGGSEPIYVCEGHARQLGHSHEHCSDVRIITAESDHSSDPIRSQDQTQIQEVSSTKPNPIASSEVSRTRSRTKVATATTVPSARPRLRDLTYGNAAKAMVDEVIWNMAAGDYHVYRTALHSGKSAVEASQAAGGQVAVVHRKISDYKLKLEVVLSESKAIINVAETIDGPLEQAALEIISNGEIND